MLAIVALCGVGLPVFAAQPELHTPPKGSFERQALMDALRDAYKTSRNREGKLNRGNITFHVYYLKVHNGGRGPMLSRIRLTQKMDSPKTVGSCCI
jgi:hypothetical protein